MHDTPGETYRRQVALWQAKSFAERMRLGGEADNMAWRDAKRLVQRQSDDPAALFLALHRDCISPQLLAWFAAELRKRSTSTAVI